MAYDEGVIKFETLHTEAPLPEDARARGNEIVAWRRVFIKLGLIGRDRMRYGGAGFGNLSARIPPYPGERGARRFVVTGSQTATCDETSIAPLSVVEAYDPKANWVRSHGPVKPSSESMTHGALYDLSPRIRWVFHGHVPILWENAADLGIACTAAGVAYGTPEMAGEMARLYRGTNLSESSIVAMLGHEDGIITFGHTAEEAGGVMTRYLAAAYARAIDTPLAERGRSWV
jgi:ribulose-5-phosphate 4-epimerase/fuculose-1-phosphate aldolase